MVSPNPKKRRLHGDRASVALEPSVNLGIRVRSCGNLTPETRNPISVHVLAHATRAAGMRSLFLWLGQLGHTYLGREQ